jgi:hypothetical protein
MSSPSPEPNPNEPIHLQRALMTVEAFLQASCCPEYTKNAWLYLKKAINELSTTPRTPTTLAQDKILKRLSAIETKLSAPTAMLSKSPTYADCARLAPSQSILEKPVPGRALKEVMVTVIDVPKPSQTSQRQVESINAAHSSKAGKVLAARKLKSGDICVATDRHETKTHLEQDEEWTQVIVGRMKVRGRRFTVMAHSVRMNRFNTKNQQKALAELQA